MTDATAGGMRATAHPKSSLLEQNALTELDLLHAQSAL